MDVLPVMDRSDVAYAKYVLRCQRIGVKPLLHEEFQFFTVGRNDEDPQANIVPISPDRSQFARWGRAAKTNNPEAILARGRKVSPKKRKKDPVSNVRDGYPPMRRHLYLKKPDQSGMDFEVARERGLDPNTPFVLGEINQWLLSLDKPGIRPMMTGQGSFWDGWDCDAWLDQEYAEYSTVVAADYTLVNRRRFLTAKEKWKSDYRSRRIHRVIGNQFYRWIQKDLLRRMLEYARMFEYTQKPQYEQVFKSTLRYGYEWKYEDMQRAESTRTYMVGLPLIPPAPTEAKKLLSTHLYRGEQFADGCHSVKLAYREQFMPFRFGTDDFSTVIMRLVVVPDNTYLPAGLELPATFYRCKHKFLDALVPAFPYMKDGLYLTLQKRGRNPNGKMENLGQLYIGRVIKRDRTPDETQEQYTALSVGLAEQFVTERMRKATKDADLLAWLAWTVRYYALKSTQLPLVPDGLEGSAWETDADGKYVSQLLPGEVFENGTTAIEVAERNDDLESWTPPGAWRG